MDRKSLFLIGFMLFILVLGGCTVDAPLQSRPTLNLSVDGDGEGVILVNEDQVEPGEALICQPGVEVTLKAVPADDSVFSGWNNGVEEKELEVIMDGDVWLTAEFASNPQK